MCLTSRNGTTFSERGGDFAVRPDDYGLFGRGQVWLDGTPDY